MGVAEQGRNFALFFIIGLFIGLIFDIFRGFRKVFKMPKVFVDIQDILFLVISGLIYFRSVLLFNSGELRFYIVLSSIIGIIIYSLTLSETCSIIIKVVFKLGELIVRNIFKSKKICIIIIAVIAIYTVIYFINQQKKLDKYQTEQAYYRTQIEELESEQEDLKKEQENMNSPDYIEEQARSKMDMYYPNERVYIAQ